MPSKPKGNYQQTGKRELAEERMQQGGDISPLFRKHRMLYPHLLPTPPREEHPSCSGPTRTKSNTDFQGVIPAAAPTVSLPQILCRHRSAFLGEETPPDCPGREAQTPIPVLPLAFLPAFEKRAQNPPHRRDSPSTSLGTLPQAPPDLGEAPLTPHGVPVHPFTSGHPTHREQPLCPSGSAPHFRKHLLSPHNNPHRCEHAPVHTSGHPTPERAEPLHLRTPHTSGDTPDSPQDTLLRLSPPSERRPEAPQYLLRRQLHMQGAGGGAGR